MEHHCWRNSKYSRQECLEISCVPDKTDQKDLEDTALNIFRKLDVDIDSSIIENCHLLLSDEPKYVTVKFSKLKDANRIRLCKKNLKEMDLTSLSISCPAFINDNLCQYYKILWQKCKKLLTDKLINFFWVSNRSVRLRVWDKDSPASSHILWLERSASCQSSS